MVYVEINASQFITAADARRIGQAAALILQTDKGITIRHKGEEIPLVEPTYDRSKVTRGRQEAEATLLKLASKVKTVWGADLTTLGAAPMILDADTRTWSVDYKTLVEHIRVAFPGDVDKLNTFREIVREVLADEALRGISMK